ncbi:MAG TPA: N-acetylmuramidase family protein [Fluviicoccus sp.]|nr:N-acetylmuramidase family protein [Fluviicoccus sp.]
MTDKRLKAEDYSAAAAALGVPVAAVRAVTDVESKGSGFLEDGRPVILFERHIMRHRLLQVGRKDVGDLQVKFPSIVNSKPGGYKGGKAEHDRLGLAATIHRQCALESCSWGLFQIMGFHWKALGYASVQEFINAMYRNEAGQLDAFVRFIKANPNLLKALKAQDWAAFAKGYNGPGYAANKYDTKMAAAFEHHSKQEAA